MRDWPRIIGVGLSFLLSLGVLHCESEKEDSGGGGRKYTLDFIGGVKALGDRPASTSTPQTPFLRDFSYYPIVRQGGALSGVITFDDDDYTKVTTLVFQVAGSGQYFIFPVTPLEDPLNPGVFNINFKVELDARFKPGTYTLYVGLVDEDGSVSAYLSRLLVVKSLKELAIAELIPAQGSVVSVNAVIQARFSQQVFPGEAEIVLLHHGETVPGSMRLLANGRAMVFTPAELLAPGQTYVVTATILVNGKSLSTTFTTLNPPPLSAPANLAGKTFGAILSAENMAEPEEGKLIFDMITGIPPILTRILTVNVGSGELTSMGGMAQPDGAGGWKQATLVPAFGPNPAELENPWFRAGPAELVVPLAALGLPGSVGFHELKISGHFTTDQEGNLTGFDHGVLTGRLDSQEINAILKELTSLPMDLCQLVPLCDDQGYIFFRAENITGFLIPEIDALYGLALTTDVSEINAALGGSLQITCVAQRDGEGFASSDLSLFSRTGASGSEVEVGTWDYLAGDCASAPPVCHVPPSGEVTVQVTLAPGELSAGDKTFRVGCAYDSPPGTITTAKGISVE